MRPKAIDVKILDNYEIEILFDNQEKRIFDVKPYFKFKKVKVSGLSIEWENGADICPDELYNNSNKIA